MWRSAIVPLHLSVDRSSPVPLYFQVAAQLEQAIADGELAPGSRVPNEMTLADELGLSRPTMRQALQTLVDRGMLVRKRGVGTQVVKSQIRRPVELTSLKDDLLRAGQDPGTVVLSLSQSPADAATAADLHLNPGEPVWRLERLRSVGDQPLALMSNVLPCELVDLASIDLSKLGLYEALRRAGIHLRVAHQRIGSRRAGAREARLLNERRGSPLLTMQRTAYDDAGRAVELGLHAYRPDLYSFEVTLVDR
jgi:DNA-binding GntR family transcriptional regulator